MATSSNTYQAWYPGTAVYSAYGYNYFEIGNNDSYYSAPKIKGLYDWIVNMYGNADSCGYDKLIFFRVLESMGTHFCVMIFSFILAIVKKRRNQVAFIAFIIVMVLGYLFGPLSSIRYYLILFMVSPILCLFDFNVSTSKKLYNTQ